MAYTSTRNKANRSIPFIVYSCVHGNENGCDFTVIMLKAPLRMILMSYT